ncbi:hypothetical protein EON64_21320, partial [archaeon]
MEVTDIDISGLLQKLHAYSQDSDMLLPPLRALADAFNTTPTDLSAADAALFVQLLGHRDATAVEAAVMAVWQASFHSPNHLVLTDAQVIHTLCILLCKHVDHAVIVEYTVRICWNLSSAAEMNEHIVSSSLIEVLLALLHRDERQRQAYKQQ